MFHVVDYVTLFGSLCRCKNWFKLVLFIITMKKDKKKTLKTEEKSLFFAASYFAFLSGCVAFKACCYPFLDAGHIQKNIKFVKIYIKRQVCNL